MTFHDTEATGFRSVGLADLDTVPDVESELVRAFPRDHQAPEAGTRQTLIEGLHTRYLAYLDAPEAFETIPRLNALPSDVRTEDGWVAWEDRQVDLSRLPERGSDFAAWFNALGDAHVQPEFCRYLADDATLPEIALFFLAEEMVDSRFDDLMALAQLGCVGKAKLTLAENYWDEMGEGVLEHMHTVLFEHSAQYMRTVLAERGFGTAHLRTREVIENATLPLMYSLQRHWAPRALGALGLMEYSAPPRFRAMVDGCTRLGVPEDVITYQRIHIHVDDKHGAEWLEQVLVPMANRSPALLREISLGVLTRERVANAYYARVTAQMLAIR